MAFTDLQRPILSVSLDYDFVVPLTAAMTIVARARHARVAVQVE